LHSQSERNLDTGEYASRPLFVRVIDKYRARFYAEG